MSLPLVGYLAAAGGVRLTVVARERCARLYAGIGDVPDLIVVSDANRFERIAGGIRILRRIGADGAVVLAPSFSSALAPFLAGVGVRAGIRSDGRGAFLNASIPARGMREEHLSKTYLRLGRILLERLGMRADHEFTAASPVVFDGDRRAVADRLKEAGIGEGKGYAVVVPGAAYGETKMWPREKYRELVRALAEEMPVVLAGSSAERGLCEVVGNGLRGVSNMAGRTTLGEFMALLEDARCLVANDSGAPHLAASLGTPVVVIFGSTSPAWTSPLGNAVRVVREPVACSPCFLKRCPRNLECYAGISAGRVLAEALGAAVMKGEKKMSPRPSR